MYGGLIDNIDLSLKEPYNSFIHFDFSFYSNEIMVKNVNEEEPNIDRKIFSKFTAALLMDTTWYSVNYEMFEEPTFGKNTGCDFLINTDCEAYGKSIYKDYCTLPKENSN